LNGSGSHDPNGEVLTYLWTQVSGPVVAITNANQPIASFQAAAGQSYQFKLTVRNTDNLFASAYTRVSTVANQAVDILFFLANPTTSEPAKLRLSRIESRTPHRHHLAGYRQRQCQQWLDQCEPDRYYHLYVDCF